MRALAHSVSGSGSAVRRWAVLLTLSAVFHVMVLGTFALRLPASVAPYSAPQAMDVSLVAPFVRPQLSPAAAPPKPARIRVVVLGTAPRYATPAKAATGEASDVVDVFGPVFADGLWPRPLVVRKEPCESEGDPERAAGCMRELMLIGLASEAEAGSKARP